MNSELNKALLFFGAALVCYTVGLWLSRRKCYFNSITFLLFGVVFNLLGTSHWDWSLHSVLGALSLVAMAILAICGFMACRFYEKKLFEIFRRLLPYAYGVWIISLIAGIFNLVK